MVVEAVCSETKNKIIDGITTATHMTREIELDVCEEEELVK